MTALAIASRLRAPEPGKRKGATTMPIGTIMSLLPVIFRIIQEAPHLVNEVESFWNTVTAGQSVHPTVQVAVQSAFHKLREGEVG